MIIVDDSFITPYESKKFYETIVKDHGRSWGLTPLVSFDNERMRDVYKINNWNPSNAYQMVSTVDPTISSDATSRMAADILRTFCKHHKIEINRVTRGKLNITWSGDNLIAPHIDGQSPHLVFLYYVNDSDGDTIFYDRVWNKDIDWGDMSEEFSVSPKMGRAVLFDGFKFHTSTAPSNNARIVLNITFE
jgi:hypothetical protein